MSNLIEQIRHAQVLAAEQLVIQRLQQQGLSSSVSVLTSEPKNIKTGNTTLDLCKLIEPHLIDGQRLFASKSIVVAINDTQSLADRLADIDLTIRLLKVLAGTLSLMEI